MKTTLLLLALSLFASFVSAQTLTLTEPTLVPTGNTTPDTPPTFSAPPQFNVPPALKESSKIHFFIQTSILDKNGKNLNEHPTICSSSKLLIKPIAPKVKNILFKPAEKSGKKAPSSSWYALIFNPSSSSPDNPDATPRLLSFSPVFIDSRQHSALSLKSNFVPITLNIDADGTVRSHELPPDTPDAIKALEPQISEALAKWKFAPARKDGTPTETELSTSIAILEPPGIFKRPVPTSQPSPEFPYSMRRAGLSAKITARFIVDPKGRVTQASILESDHPALEKHVIDTVLKWKFKPATKNDVPVSAQMQIPFHFKFEDGDGRGLLTIEKLSKKQLARLPENLRYDTPPTVTGFIIPAYPYNLLSNGTNGSATVHLVINDTGRVVFSQITKSTHPEFAASLLAAADHFKYAPATLKGSTVISNVVYEHEFYAPSLRFLTTYRDSDSTSDYDDYSLLSLEKKNSPKIIPVNKLDSVPDPVSQRKPLFPLAAPDGISSGKATIEFLIDETGQVRLPRIINATDPAFGYAAAQTITQWRFTPPLQNGKPVISKVRVPVSFTIPKE